MSNVRLIWDNAADRATITASTTSGTLAASNMQNNYKGLVHRSAGKTVTYTLSWSSNESIGGIALPCINLSSTATVSVTLYSDVAATTQIATSGSTTPVFNSTWDTTATSVNTFSYGQYTKCAVWFSQNYATVRACKIIINDTNNVAGYIDCARIVVGPWWSSTYNIRNGVSLDITDSSKISRTEAGSLVADRGYLYDKIRFDFSLLTESDRQGLTNIFRKVGASKNIFVSCFPELTEDKQLEYDYMIYGKRSNSSLQQERFKYYNNSVDIEGW